MITKYRFIKQGSVVKLKKNTLYLDVGNALKKGIIDHHHPSAPKLSATMLVYKYPQFIPKNTKTIILHNFPDMDCIASSFLANYYLKYNKFPIYIKKLALFVNNIDFGRSPKCIISLYSLFLILKTKCKSNQEVVNRGHRLIEQCSKYGFDNNTTPIQYKNYIQEIKKDKYIYFEDFKKSEIMNFNVPFKNKKGKISVKCLVSIEPKSNLFKDWARNDSRYCDNGFDMLIVQLNKTRVIISLKPDGFTYLKGLGHLLNKEEKRIRMQKNIVLNEKNRVGYDMPDPWYDGRNPLHNWTIIDTPMRGSELMLNEIINITKRWSDE